MAKSNTVKKQFYLYGPGDIFTILANVGKIQVHLMNFSYFPEWHYFALSNNESPKFWERQKV